MSNPCTDSSALQRTVEPSSDVFRNSVHVCYRGGRPLSLGPEACPGRIPPSSPAIELAGLKIFAARDGDRVAGRVEFPYVVAGRTSLPIDYRNAPCGTAVPALPLDVRAQARLAMVIRWRSLCQSEKSATRIEHARRVCADAVGLRCSPRSLQLWARKLDTEGPEGLCDRYEPAPRKVLSLDTALAAKAVQACAWWAFRIANVAVIDSPMMHSAASLFAPSSPRPGACPGRVSSSPYLADVLAAIDCYYSWPCDRRAMPFKSFARWAKYDFQKWLARACDENDYRAKLPDEPTPLQAALTVDREACQVPDSRTRRRDVRQGPTRRAIRDLALSETSAHGTVPSSLYPPDPSSAFDAVLALDDRLRIMLFSAARGDAQARRQAAATLPLWWDRMPETVRHNIDARLSPAHHHERGMTDKNVKMRNLLAFLSYLHRHRRDAVPMVSAAGLTP